MVAADADEHDRVAASMGDVEGPFAGVVEGARQQAAVYLGGHARDALDKLRTRIEALSQADYIVDCLAARLAEAEICLYVGEPKQALTAADHLREIAEHLGAASELADSARVRALAASALGQSLAADEALAQARSLAAEVGEPALRWRVLPWAASSPDPGQYVAPDPDNVLVPDCQQRRGRTHVVRSHSVRSASERRKASEYSA